MPTLRCIRCCAASGQDCGCLSMKAIFIDVIDTHAHAHQWSAGRAARRCGRGEAAAGARTEEQDSGPGACSRQIFVLFAVTSVHLLLCAAVIDLQSSECDSFARALQPARQLSNRPAQVRYQNTVYLLCIGHRCTRAGVSVSNPQRAEGGSRRHGNSYASRLRPCLCSRHASATAPAEAAYALELQ